MYRYRINSVVIVVLVAQWCSLPYRCNKMGTLVTSFHIPSPSSSSSSVSIRTTTTTTTTTTALKSTTTNNFNSVFPISTRQALIERSKQINEGIIASSSSTGYTSAGWSNRAATVLTPVHVDPVGVYTADRPFYWNRIDVGCRATIIEMPSSSSSSNKPDLFIHSPVNLDGPMIQCLQQIGNVRYICSTNYEHVKYAAMWYQNYGITSSSSSSSTSTTSSSSSSSPPADLWACPGLQSRMPEIPWKGEIPNGYRPISWQINSSNSNNDNNAAPLPSDPVGIWDTSILQPLHINIEHNPFTQRPFFNEVIYYHAPTKTLLCTDLFWNYPSADGIPNSQFYKTNTNQHPDDGTDQTWELAPAVPSIPIGSQLWKLGMDQIYYPFFNRCMITNPSEYQQIAHHILNVWDVETVIPAHGDIIRGKALIRSILTQYFQLEQ